MDIYKKIFIYSLLLILGVSISGCAMFQKKSEETSGASSGEIAGLAKVMKFEDVPVPAGFRLIDADSFIFQNDQIRIGLLKYSGMPNAEKVVNFFKEQMPMYNWDLINIVEYGKRIMNFERRDQTCIITIEPSRLRTAITIAVAPKATAPMTEERVQRYKELKDKPSKFDVKELK